MPPRTKTRRRPGPRPRPGPHAPRGPHASPAEETVSLETFWRAYASFRDASNAASRKGVEAPPDAGVFIVAGPGTGKTTCLTLRILKLILVDGLQPGRIVATTFTVKAAAEL